jgi:transcription initiation factor TFIIB
MLHTEKTEKEIRRCTQAIAFYLGLRFPAFDPTGFVARFSSELGLSTEIERTAQRVAFEFTCRSRQQLQGKDPKGVIAASIYYACQLHNHSYSQTVIGGHIGTTEVTLRTRLTEIRDFLLLHPLPLIA